MKKINLYTKHIRQNIQIEVDNQKVTFKRIRIAYNCIRSKIVNLLKMNNLIRLRPIPACCSISSQKVTPFSRTNSFLFRSPPHILSYVNITASYGSIPLIPVTIRQLCKIAPDQSSIGFYKDNYSCNNRKPYLIFVSFIKTYFVLSNKFNFSVSHRV
jgi:hypothetical protein